MIVAAAAFHFLDREFLVAQEGFKQRLNFHGFYFYLRFAAGGRKRWKNNRSKKKFTN